ncbi:hypothetical protein CLV59_101195 [Chitinophaga dinghuensis]|uniref:Uncharacterized protein n=1 Tax=Chitinophaga dinghuensis TaxID=1539050 RepID=A0A327WI70_9BACT|nr:hypothetical protein [Chitinophaga dinghuensis]RAJ87444.1 hypothetical protein CLV59_101195 [Chitinophaga dinghuensis]
MKPIIILLLIIAGIELPGIASAQDQKVPIKTSDGAVVKTKQEALPVKPGNGTQAGVQRAYTTPSPQGAKPVSANPSDKSPVAGNPAAGKIPGTTSTIPAQQLFKPVATDARPPVIEQQGPPPGPANSNKPVMTPKPANQ